MTEIDTGYYMSHFMYHVENIERVLAHVHKHVAACDEGTMVPWTDLDLSGSDNERREAYLSDWAEMRSLFRQASALAKGITKSSGYFIDNDEADEEVFQ
jgi:hypothetical protein